MSSKTCIAITQAGKRCKNHPVHGSDCCNSHKESCSRSGRAKCTSLRKLYTKSRSGSRTKSKTLTPSTKTVKTSSSVAKPTASSSTKPTTSSSIKKGGYSKKANPVRFVDTSQITPYVSNRKYNPPTRPSSAVEELSDDDFTVPSSNNAIVSYSRPSSNNAMVSRPTSSRQTYNYSELMRRAQELNAKIESLYKYV